MAYFYSVYKVLIGSVDVYFDSSAMIITKGKPISGIADANAMEGVFVYHAGTTLDDEGNVLTNGGRVLDVTAIAPSFEEARNKAYQACDRISFEGKTYRHDIGIKAIKGRANL